MCTHTNTTCSQHSTAGSQLYMYMLPWQYIQQNNQAYHMHIHAHRHCLTCTCMQTVCLSKDLLMEHRHSDQVMVGYPARWWAKQVSLEVMVPRGYQAVVAVMACTHFLSLLIRGEHSQNMPQTPPTRLQLLLKIKYLWGHNMCWYHSSQSWPTVLVKIAQTVHLTILQL